MLLKSKAIKMLEFVSLDTRDIFPHKAKSRKWFKLKTEIRLSNKKKHLFTKLRPNMKGLLSFKKE